MMDMFLIFISLIILIIMVLISVAFLTLLERKVLGYIQIRKGPNKVGLMGIFQPFSDAIKLFSKEQMYPYMTNFMIFYFSPILNLILALGLWMSMPFFCYLMNFSFSVMYFLVFSSLSVYAVMMSGWSSNSFYSLLGSLRSVAQTISYEVSMFLILLSLLILVLSLDLLMFKSIQLNIWFLLICLPLSLMWLVTSLAETNRTPFDFAEGESELVSGFNIEYSSGGFALIFLAEYANILFMSMLFSLIFLGGKINSLIFYIFLVFISFFWLWVRGTLPRFRYDKLMNLAWKVFLPVSLNFILFFFCLKLFLLILIF
uniref:NADH-ubiquinone oxidoreductase chain 1 n=1 Tax=Curculionoidea sp. 10 KM-2017 TaxID=2219393 RepID=A0A346RIA3_9CUCU|nr:NADH dehydrogenase subunit 1 [Curculionoidea sp. 10 KM-2017]